jgi:hypothetical protein
MSIGLYEFSFLLSLSSFFNISLRDAIFHKSKKVASLKQLFSNFNITSSFLFHNPLIVSVLKSSCPGALLFFSFFMVSIISSFVISLSVLQFLYSFISYIICICLAVFDSEVSFGILLSSSAFIVCS